MTKLLTTVSPAPQVDSHLDDLAHLIAANGIGHYESDVARLVVRLRGRGHTGSLTDLLADRSAAAIVRERAFGSLVGHLARGPARGQPPIDTAA